MLPQALATPQGRATPSPFSDRLRAQGPPLTRLQPGKRVPYHDASNTTGSSLSLDQLDSLRRQSNLSTLSLSPRRPATTSHTARQPRPSFSFGVQINDDESLDDEDYVAEREDGGVSPAESWTTVDRMRCWRNDAMTQHLYDSAKFWGAKVLGMTGEPLPADCRYWFSCLHFSPLRRQSGRRILACTGPLLDAPICASRARLDRTVSGCIDLDCCTGTPDRHVARLPLPSRPVQGPLGEMGGSARARWPRERFRGCSGLQRRWPGRRGNQGTPKLSASKV